MWSAPRACSKKKDGSTGEMGRRKGMCGFKFIQNSSSLVHCLELKLSDAEATSHIQLLKLKLIEMYNSVYQH